MKKNVISRLGLAVLRLSILLIALTGPARADLTGYVFTAAWGRSYDVGWEVSVCTLYIQRFPHVDSVFKFGMTRNNVDTMSFFANVSPAIFNPAYVATFWARITTNETPPRRLPIDVDKPTFLSKVDSLTEAISCGSSGSGPFSDSIKVLKCTDSTVIGAGILVHLVPNGGGGAFDDLTDANGWAVFSVPADTYFVYAATAGFFQQTVPDTSRVPAVNSRDTVFMCPVSVPTSPGPALTGITFRFFEGSGDSLRSAVLYYKLDVGSSIAAWSYDSTKVFDPGRVFTAQTNVNGTVTVFVVPNDSIYTDAYGTQKTRWIFWGKSPINGDHLLGKDGVKVYVPASQTALAWPQDFP